MGRISRESLSTVVLGCVSFSGFKHYQLMAFDAPVTGLLPKSSWFLLVSVHTWPFAESTIAAHVNYEISQFPPRMK
jgi:hypothetical protein